MTDDRRLLQDYVESGSRPALETLVQRHLGLVYSSALRQLRDPHLAEDVTQAVFLVLTQKARTIRQGVATGGWLLAVTRCVVVNVMRKQAIRIRHERGAARPESLESVAGDWAEIAPLLDAELNRLARTDRDAVVLRFFQDKSFAEVGAELGLSEDAARMRVGRALDRLRARLDGRKLSMPTGALAATMGMFAVGAVPKHLVASTIAARVCAPAPHCMMLAKGAIKMIAWTKAKLVSTVAATLFLGGTGVVVVTQPIARPAVESLAAAPATQASPATEIMAIAIQPLHAQAAAPAAMAAHAALPAPAAAPAPAGPHGRRGNETTSS